MPYAIVVYFDDITNNKIRNIWKKLADNNVCNYMWNSENEPHIKLFMLDDIDEKECIKIIEEDIFIKQKISLQFKNYGIFPNKEPILFLDTSPNMALLNLQQTVKNRFFQYSHKISYDFFDEDKFNPDCFLTVSITKDKAIKGIQILLNEELPFSGTIEYIGLIKFHPAERIYQKKM